MKLHLLCSTNRVPLSYELTAANVAYTLLVRELLAGAGLGEGEVARRLLGDLAYRSSELREELAERGILLATEKADRRPPIRQQVEVCFAALKGVFGMDGTLAKTLVGLVTRIATKVASYTYGVSTSPGCSVILKAASEFPRRPLSGNPVNRGKQPPISSLGLRALGKFLRSCCSWPRRPRAA